MGNGALFVSFVVAHGSRDGAMLADHERLSLVDSVIRLRQPVMIFPFAYGTVTATLFNRGPLGSAAAQDHVLQILGE
jgi:hypothetical protein